MNCIYCDSKMIRNIYLADAFYCNICLISLMVSEFNEVYYIQYYLNNKNFSNSFNRIDTQNDQCAFYYHTNSLLIYLFDETKYHVVTLNYNKTPELKEVNYVYLKHLKLRNI